MKSLRYMILPILLMGCEPSHVAMRQFAEEYVKERRVKWQDRVHAVPSVVVQTPEDVVLNVMGPPDNTSDSVTTKNWLYWVDPKIQGDQVCMDALILKIAGGVVVERRLGPGLRQDMDVFYRKAHR